MAVSLTVVFAALCCYSPRSIHEDDDEDGEEDSGEVFL